MAIRLFSRRLLERRCGCVPAKSVLSAGCVSLSQRIYDANCSGIETVKSFRVTAAVLFTIATAGATGWFGPMVYLDEGGRNVDASPEFFWDLEVKRIAQE